MNIDRFLKIMNSYKEYISEEINFADVFIKNNPSCKLDFVYNTIAITDEHGTIVFQIVRKEQDTVKFYDMTEIVRDIVNYEEDFGIKFNL